MWLKFSLKREINLLFHFLNLAWLYDLLWTIECSRSERMSLPSSGLMRPVVYLALLHLCHHRESKIRVACYRKRGMEQNWVIIVSLLKPALTNQRPAHPWAWEPAKIREATSPTLSWLNTWTINIYCVCYRGSRVFVMKHYCGNRKKKDSLSKVESYHLA